MEPLEVVGAALANRAKRDVVEVSPVHPFQTGEILRSLMTITKRSSSSLLATELKPHQAELSSAIREVRTRRKRPRSPLKRGPSLPFPRQTIVILEKQRRAALHALEQVCTANYCQCLLLIWDSQEDEAIALRTVRRNERMCDPSHVTPICTDSLLGAVSCTLKSDILHKLDPNPCSKPVLSVENRMQDCLQMIER